MFYKSNVKSHNQRIKTCKKPCELQFIRSLYHFFNVLVSSAHVMHFGPQSKSAFYTAWNVINRDRSEYKKQKPTACIFC